MNIEINLLPEELRAKPLIDTRTFVLIVIILALGFGCFYFFNATSNAETEISNLQDEIKTTQQQTKAISSNPEAVQLTNFISQLKTATQNYEALVASSVGWGAALEGVYSLIPRGVEVASINQTGNALQIKGTASSYTEVSDYGRALDNDPRFALLGLPSFGSAGFALTISVAPGGAR